MKILVLMMFVTTLMAAKEVGNGGVGLFCLNDYYRPTQVVGRGELLNLYEKDNADIGRSDLN